MKLLKTGSTSNAQILRQILGYIPMGRFSIEIETKGNFVTIFIYETKSGAFFTVGLSESNDCTFAKTFGGETEDTKVIDCDHLLRKLSDIARGYL